MIKGADVMEEKILILKMLEEGKITSEEALKLLESLGKDNEERNYEEKNTPDSKLNDTINKFSKKAEKFAEKIGPDFISRVENVSTDFADAAVKFADKMVGFFSNGFSNADIYKTVSKNFSFPINNPEKLRIILKTQNLAITANASDTSEVSLNMKLNLLDEITDVDKHITALAEDDIINIETNFPSKVWGKLEIRVPKNMEIFQIESSNSKCSIEDLKAKSLYCNTSNGKIEFLNCSCQTLQAKTNNGKIIMSHSQATCATLDTSNGGIEMENSCFDKLKSYTSNGNIYLSHFYSINPGEAVYDLQTTNGKIKITLDKDSNIAYKINADTTLGNINISDLEPSYIIDRNNSNMKASASVVSGFYNNAENKMFIEAATTNASINIINE